MQGFTTTDIRGITSLTSFTGVMHSGFGYCTIFVSTGRTFFKIYVAVFKVFVVIFCSLSTGNLLLVN